MPPFIPVSQSLFFSIQLVLCLLCFPFPGKLHLCSVQLWRARSVAGCRGKTPHKNVLLLFSSNVILMWKQTVAVIAAEQLGELLGSCWEGLDWPHIQQLIGSQVWWELPQVLFAAEKMLRGLELPSCNGENIATLNYHIDERCFDSEQLEVRSHWDDAVIAALCKNKPNDFTKCHHYVLFCVLDSDSGANGELKSSPKQRQAALQRVHLVDWGMCVCCWGGRMEPSFTAAFLLNKFITRQVWCDSVWFYPPAVTWKFFLSCVC